MTRWQWQPEESSPAKASTTTTSNNESPRYHSGRPREEVERLCLRVHQKLIEELDTEKLDGLSPEQARQAVEMAIRTLLTRDLPDVTGLLRDEITARVADDVLGLGPIEPLLKDPRVSEVMVNGPNEVYYERDGIIRRSDIGFRDNDHIMRVIERIISPLGRRVDEASPMVDARLADGSRVNIVIPPITPRSPVITIRKFRADKHTVKDLINVGTLTEEAANFLRACVHVRLNVLISGGTGTGKTTLLNALSAFIPETERIITIEDPTEVRLQQPHVVAMEARPPSLEGKNAVTQRDMVRNALRMRPDRIIVGEVRGAEAFDMLQAMNTGHEGSLTTIHANSPRDALHRVENMVMMAGFDLPVRVIREQTASAIHIIIQIARFSDGSRKVTHITEVTGMEGEVITIQDIFRFHQEGIDPNGKIIGQLQATGIRPSFAERFTLAGINLPMNTFTTAGW